MTDVHLSEKDRARLASLGALAEYVPNGLALFGRDGEIVRANHSMAEITGFDRRHHYGRRLEEVQPATWKRLKPIFERVANGELYDDGVVSSSQSDLGDELGVVVDEVRYWTTRYFPVRDEGRVLGVAALVTDVTEQERAKQGRDNSQSSFHLLRRLSAAAPECTTDDELYHVVCAAIVEHTPVTFAWIGRPRNGDVTPVAWAGEDRGYLDGLYVSSLNGDDYAQGPGGRAIRSGLDVVVDNVTSTSILDPWRDRLDRAGFLSMAAFPIKMAGGTAALLSVYAPETGTVGASAETIRGACSLVSLALNYLEADRPRRMTRDLLMMRDGALGAITQGIAITDALAIDMPIIYVSPSFLQLVGYSRAEVMGRNCRFLQGPDTKPEAVATIRRAISLGQGCEVDILNYRKDGTSFWNHLALSPIFDDEGIVTRFIGVQSDVSHERLLESQIVQAQRLEAIGTLAGGVAHDFNNLLLVMQGYLSLINAKVSDRELAEYVTQVQNAVTSATDLTRHLLAYSRSQHIEPRSLDPNVVLAESLKLVSSLLGDDVVIETDLGDVKPIFMDPSQIHQIIINLVANARDAMPKGGTLRLATSLNEVNEARDDLVDAPAAGQYVLVEVADTGVGMSEDVVRRVFEPFFSTKPTGTGLGLASVFGIVQQNAGHISAESSPGHGTTFRVLFPIFEGVTPSMEVDEPRFDEASLRGHERVLVVDDSESVRLLVQRTLEGFGYQVTSVGDAKSALSLIIADPHQFNLVITDVVMPEMNGRQLAEAVLESAPTMKIIFTSGYPANVLRDRFYLDRGATFIAKPYRATVLLRSVRQSLNATSR